MSSFIRSFVYGAITMFVVSVLCVLCNFIFWPLFWRDLSATDKEVTKETAAWLDLWEQVNTLPDANAVAFSRRAVLQQVREHTALVNTLMDTSDGELLYRLAAMG